MKRRKLASLLAAWMVAGAYWAGSAAAQTPPPVEAFGRLPAIADAAISPDGTKIAFARFDNGQGSFLVYDIDSKEHLFGARLHEADQQLRGIGWADDERVTFHVSVTFHPGAVLPYYVRMRGSPRRVDYHRTGVANLATKRMRYLTTDEDQPWADHGSPVIAPIDGDSGYGRMFGWSSPYEGRTRLVFRVNLDNGNARAIRTRGASKETLFYILDERGEVALRADSHERTNRWRIFTYDGEEPRLLLEDVSDTGRPVPVAGLMPDGRLGVIDWDEAGERESLIAIDRASGASALVFQAEDLGGIDHAENDPWTGRIVGVSWTDEQTRQKFFDPHLQSAADSVADYFEGAGSIISWSRDRRRFLVYGERGLDGGGYYIFEPAQNRILLIEHRYPQLAAGGATGDRQSITYPARDGVRIPAYLTFPPGAAQARGLPLVLLVHGGPHSRDTFAFDWWASFLASRGYLVLQPNFRGSSGYSRAWEEAGWRQWGGLMQTDVEDGVAALARAGMIDPARVCIVGGSYGGYAALAGATLTPERYACAVSVAGVSDLEAMLRTERAETGAQSMMSDYWRRSIGDRAEDRERIRAVSPANLADRVRAPILLLHGTDDTVVPIAQSQLMDRRLRAAGKQVRFVTLEGDDHWLSDEPTRIQMLREIEAFLAQHIGAGRAP